MQLTPVSIYQVDDDAMIPLTEMLEFLLRVIFKVSLQWLEAVLQILWGFSCLFHNDLIIHHYIANPMT